MSFDTDEFLYRPNRKLASFDTKIDKPKNVGDLLKEQVEKIGDLQETLFADGRHAVLFVFQGMDCAGKDSTIKNVLSGVNPQGITVSNFGAPTSNEVAHSYLWRYWRAMPRRGMIGIFNRSHYEEVVVMRVHSEFFEERHMPHPELSDEFWDARCQDIASLETHLGSGGIHVVKFFLNLSKDEQKARLLGRIDRPHKNWKFDPRDMVERGLWDDFQDAYKQAIQRTHTDDSPWYIIPADHKPTMRALVAQVVAEKLASLPIATPEASEEQKAALASARATLMSED